MAKSAGNTFARGKGSVVAAGLDAPIATIRQFREQGIEGPWELVEDVLVSVDFALRTRDVGAFDELSKTARTVFEKMWIKAGVHSHDERVVADFVLDLRRPSRRAKNKRLETLAAFVGESSKRTDVRVEVYRTAQLLPSLFPELRFKYKAEDMVLFRPHPFSPPADELRDGTSRLARDLGLDAKTERRLGAFLVRKGIMKLPASGDGRAIVRCAARFCGLPEHEIRRLFGSTYTARHRARKQGRRSPDL